MKNKTTFLSIFLGLSLISPSVYASVTSQEASIESTEACASESYYTKISDVYNWFAEEPTWRVAVPVASTLILVGTGFYLYMYAQPETLITATTASGVVMSAVASNKDKIADIKHALNSLLTQTTEEQVLNLIKYAQKQIGKTVFAQKEGVASYGGMFRVPGTQKLVLEAYEIFISGDFYKLSHDQISFVLKAALTHLKITFNPAQGFTALEKALLEFMAQFVGDGKSYPHWYSLGKAFPTLFYNPDVMTFNYQTELDAAINAVLKSLNN
jgi:hypothetical protein